MRATAIAYDAARTGEAWAALNRVLTSKTPRVGDTCSRHIDEGVGLRRLVNEHAKVTIARLSHRMTVDDLQWYRSPGVP